MRPGPRHMRRPAFVGLLLAIATSQGHAQVRGVPITASGAPEGVSAALVVAFPDDALGGGTAWAASVALQHGRLGAVATGALVDGASAPAEAVQLTNGSRERSSIHDRHPQHQGTDPLSRIDRTEIGVAHAARGVEVAERH